MKSSTIPHRHSIAAVMFFVMLALPLQAHADVVKYTYDSSGNRTIRERLVIQASPERMPVEQGDTLALAPDAGAITPTPQQSGDMVTVTAVPGGDGRFSCFLYDPAGRRLSQAEGVETAAFDMTQYPAGVYMLVIWDGGNRTVWKIVWQ